MKFFKKSLLVGIFVLLSMCFIKPAAPATQTEAAVIDSTVFSYVTISKYGQTLTIDHFKNTDNQSYIITNDSLTITLKPFTHQYEVDLTGYESDFHVNTVTKNIEQDEDGNYLDYFLVYNEEEQIDKPYYIRQNRMTGIVDIYADDPSKVSGLSPIISTSRSNIFTYSEAEHTITYTTSYTVKSTSHDTFFNFTIRTISSVRNYSIGFLRPVVEFANSDTENILNFVCEGLDAGDNGFVNEILPRELAYNSVQVKFLNNNYTEYNQLYFNINFNGFIYNFEMYSKVYDDKNLLFVNYIDPVKESNNSYLATNMVLDGSGELVVDTQKPPVYAMNGEEFNFFSMIFSQTGRYEIEIYDSTYLLGITEPNYYKTSFYVRDNTKTNFDNIYIISQIQDDEGNDIEYIVSTSTLNNNVKTTIKNLNNFGKDGSGKNIKLEDVISKIEVKKTTFGGSTNIPTFTNYTPADISSKLLENGDFVLNFTDDAYYEITIYKAGNENESIYYEITIVKHAKTTFTIPLVDEDGKPIFDEKGKQKSDTYEATEPFKTETFNYSKNILSSMVLRTKFSISELAHSTTLNKTYINSYTISYGVQQVKIQKYELTEKEKETNKEDALRLEFMGIGELTIEVTVNGKTTIHKLNYEQRNYRLELKEYGNYSIKLTDSMGTETTASYKHAKKLNFSALALIGLSSIIVLVIVLFVLKARGKVATR